MKLKAFIKKEAAIGNAASTIRFFYKSRNYQFAWFTENGIAEHTRSFRSLHNNYINDFADTALKFEQLHKELNLFMQQDSLATISPVVLL